jgi:hypothetical protein
VSGVGGSETGRIRSYEIVYPASRKPTALIHTSVLLEMGVRGGPHPHTSVPISCLLRYVLEAAGTDLGEFDDLTPFEIAVHHPGRTLLEKLVLSMPWPSNSPRTTRQRLTGAAADRDQTETRPRR